MRTLTEVQRGAQSYEKGPMSKILSTVGEKSGVLQVPGENVALAAPFLIQEPLFPRLRFYDATFGLFDHVFSNGSVGIYGRD